MPDSHTIAENLTRLATVRTNIATAITTKGGTVASGAGFEDFPTAIGTIPSGGGNQDLIDLIEGDITSLTIPSGTTSIRDNCFSEFTQLTSVTIPSSVTNIGKTAFYGCSSLTAVTIPSGVTSIGAYTFNSCTALASVVLPSSITSIGQRAFSTCRSLTALIIPSGVTSISAEAFNGCTGLTSIKFEPTTPPTVANSNAWSRLPTTCTIQVPTGSLTAYTSASNYPNPNTYTYVEY